ncbi:hypothetical protein CEK29_21175 [Bordetella genomosp. 5]|uniref:tyrosine-type recombinase/integrase n=1 Tax=Bordetella genomosp. 5 TaxID=1395608 RepID=UPI000B9E0D43|nr:site-specific integrase [Bordetella genomosp. 5]OZI33373.1 hypothetical protein CEK29_21175 [Bordetella genomosp. 5]
MAKPFKEGNGWAFRLRLNGQDVYRSGFQTEAAAKSTMKDLVKQLSADEQAYGQGPFKSTLAEAFTHYAIHKLPFLKGATQDKNRINRYLRALKLPVIQLERVGATAGEKHHYWNVSLCREPERAIPQSLKSHRTKLAGQTQKTDRLRRSLAATKIAEISPFHVQELINAMREEGAKAATITNERAELRRLFTYTKKILRWSHPVSNPAAQVALPKADAPRKRILTAAEWKRIATHLREYPNPYIFPLVCLMLETAMRSCEPLHYATWDDVQWERNVLSLRDAKAGSRDVPLGPGAIEILTALRAMGRPEASGRIIPITYEAAKKGWRVACEQAGVKNARLHDLRRTASTRYANQFNGDLTKLMPITGHKTVKMVMHYIGVTADDVARLMHGHAAGEEHSPARYQSSTVSPPLRAPVVEQAGSSSPVNVTPPVAAAVVTPAPVGRASNVVHLDFSRRVA